MVADQTSPRTPEPATPRLARWMAVLFFALACIFYALALSPTLTISLFVLGMICELGFWASLWSSFRKG